MTAGNYVREYTTRSQRIADVIDTSSLISPGPVSGSSGAYTADPTIVQDEVVSGSKFLIIPNHTNPGAATFNVSGLGATAIKYIEGGTATALREGMLQQDQPYIVVSDGTDYILMNPSFSLESYTPTLGVSAGTLSSTSVSYAKFSVEAATQKVHLEVQFQCTLSTPAAYVSFTAPTIAPIAPYEALGISNVDASVDYAGRALWIAGSAHFRIYKYDGSNHSSVVSSFTSVVDYWG